MESKAKARFVRQSPRKVRRMLETVRDMNVESALNNLHFSPQKASEVIEKTIRSAVSNFLQMEEGKEADLDDLVIKEAFVDEAPAMKRFRPASMGRASRLRKRSSHLTIVLSTKRLAQ
ncbi:MAG: 50S ribosomal protein L22 [Candidatus Marinimicrobia bacterium]|jgi:large subunit ribosomal protein L22|nr:50S ribosomal protein L22 [Candidatus Neomarinimicrobiota bacterium]MDP6456056.1 50S ribosomal protein L22 [Candidatus Neomarinimicrobiota bacterium]MDP6592655.1 50S ribosomal protein L22 [Candidatus Neomarinimicrobiota bacterium]MDP6836501.1 50S ribosomal protein L22 [Candidatus Neomarinimicrobiota bacterium]MDP6966451.1 50S ribosomal protein L22 [Candidatus Neomarinimicrobiota bacterium]|tara:strand:- start:126 stop:479 length:354 start_codon:yes stop_codon:yes gene_type:complete